MLCQVEAIFTRLMSIKFHIFHDERKNDPFRIFQMNSTSEICRRNVCLCEICHGRNVASCHQRPARYKFLTILIRSSSVISLAFFFGLVRGLFLAPAHAKSRGKCDVSRARNDIRSVGKSRGLNFKQLAKWLCFGTSPNGISTNGTVR